MTRSASFSGPPLPENGISVVLLSRGDGKFHWALGLSIPGHSSAFRKFHATQLNGPGWEFEDVQHDISQLQARKPVCVIVQIGLIRGVHTPDTIAQLMSDIPMQFPVREQKEDYFNCRVWVREALRVLEDHGVIDIGDLNKLEEEFISLGEENDSSIVMGGPYKVYCSKYYNDAV